MGLPIILFLLLRETVDFWIQGLSVRLIEILFHHLRCLVLWAWSSSRVVANYKFVVDTWNLVWVRGKATCILTSIVFLSWLAHCVVLATFSITRLFLQT